MLSKAISRVGVQVSVKRTTRVARRYKSSNTSVVAERLSAVIKSVGQDPKAHKALLDKVEASKEFPSDTLVSASLFTKHIIRHVGENETKYKDLIEAVEASPISKEIDFMDLSESTADTSGLKTPEARFVKKVAVDQLRADAKRQNAFISDATEAILPVLDKHWGLPNGNVKPSFYNWWQKLSNSMAVSQGALGEPVRVAITGAAGSIGYALAFRVASGQMFGPTTPVILHLVELPQAMKALEGVVMEIKDCAFPLVQDIVQTSDLKQGFDSIDWALLVGSKPRSKGMERGDLLMENAKIFQSQGKALGSSSKRDCKVVVVGNPANTNALIAQANSGREAKFFSALTRLDHNRGLSQLADKLNCSVTDLNRFCIWGNHSATQYPDISHTTVAKDGKLELVREVINDQAWVQKEFIPRVQKRGAEIIGARGASSAASAASAVVDHVHDWIHGTRDWTSVAIPSTGEYGVTEGLVYSYPVICGPEGPQVVQDVPIDPFSAERMEATHKELISERDAVAKML